VAADALQRQVHRLLVCHLVVNLGFIVQAMVEKQKRLRQRVPFLRSPLHRSFQL
jgi:hypothetical protein